jgi:tetratricopeptide (TPR) repeat protein
MRPWPAVLVLAIGSALPAQEGAPPRPKLGAQADSNDAQAFYRFGMEGLGRASQRHAALYWASRLEPNQTIYVYARFHTLINGESATWQRDFWRGSGYVRRSSKGQLIDSLLGEVMRRDPYAYVTLPCPRLATLARERDRVKAGLLYWSVGCYHDATTAFGEALDADPSRLELLLYRAQGFYVTRAYDSTVMALTALVDSLRGRDADHLVRAYESKATFEYMIGLAHERRGDLAAARQAYGRALAEDLGLAMAHARLARIDKAQGDTTQALAEFDLAVGLRSNDAVLRFEYGTALFELGRHAEAVAQLREAVRLEPHWAVPWFNLGIALQAQGSAADAIEAYEAFLARYPRRLEPRAQEARERRAWLEGTGGS